MSQFESYIPHVEMPFLERFREPMLTGIKTMTTRTKRYGQLGTWFEAWGQVFTLTAVYTKALGWAEEHWREKGCESAGDFRDVWNHLHPRMLFYPDKKVWVHEFRVMRRVS